MILSHYELPSDAATIVPLDPHEPAVAMRDGRVDAVFAVEQTTSRPFLDRVAALARAAGPAGLAFIPIREAPAIAARNRAVEASDLVAGAFGGEPPRPAETIPTISVTFRLMAHRNAKDETIGDVARLLLAARQTLAGELPLVQGIETPSTDKNAPLAAHPGAAAYLDGETETFFEKYGDWFYLGVMALSILASAGAALLSRMNARRRAGVMAGLSRLVAILAEARAAESEAALAEAEREADAILADALQRAAAGDLDQAGLAAYHIAVNQAARAIQDQRRKLERDAALRTS
jgi:hypothetical protein